jgi:NTP pyrophosphatase (non-canonical NTP hydrolase)
MTNQQPLVERLHIAIAHGDEEHRAWLKEAIEAHFAGKPVPEPRGQGTKEATITRLTAERDALRDASFQQRVQPWMMECFGPEIAADKLERNDRFIEEALELVQASGYPKERALALVDYVFDRDQGEINQEVGGVMVTLAAHCLAHGVDMHEAGETELARIWTKAEQIRAKHAAKPTGSALPVSATLKDSVGDEG